MTLPRFLAIFTIVLFSIIGLVALFKEKPPEVVGPIFPTIPIEIELNQEEPTIIPAPPPIPALPAIPAPTARESKPVALQAPTTEEKKEPLTVASTTTMNQDLPNANRIEELFRTTGTKLPIVETISYKSRVSWQKGRPAWLSDYALHYQTSRHFIARSLNAKNDYLTQEIKEGDRFNVLKKDKPFQFYLVVDTSRCRLWFYYIDLEAKEEVLLKTYQVGLGRLDSSKTSGLLTPLGKYALGSRITTYKPKLMGTYQGKKTEMITVFGTRWIPFDKEIGICTLPAKGFGIHGTPWKTQLNGEMIDTENGIGKYESDGCIRLATKDMEELFAIIVTKPTTIEIVRSFSDATFLR